MHARPDKGSEPPPQEQLLPIKPRLVSWTSRIWRESPGRAIPLFKIEARLEVRDVADHALQEALRPYAAQLQKIAIYVLHPEESPHLASWAVGRFDVDQKSAYMFLHDFLGRAERQSDAQPDADGRGPDRHHHFHRADDRRAAAPLLCHRRLRLRHPRPHRLASCPAPRAALYPPTSSFPQ